MFDSFKSTHCFGNGQCQIFLSQSKPSHLTVLGASRFAISSPLTGFSHSPSTSLVRSWWETRFVCVLVCPCPVNAQVFFFLFLNNKNDLARGVFQLTVSVSPTLLTCECVACCPFVWNVCEWVICALLLWLLLFIFVLGHCLMSCSCKEVHATLQRQCKEASKASTAVAVAAAAAAALWTATTAS